MIVRELVTLLRFDADTKPLERVNSSIKGLKASLTELAKIGTAAVGAILGLAETTAKAVDAEADAASAIGITTQSYQELLFAVQRFGGGLGDLQAMLARVSDQTTKAIEGNQSYRDAYRQLGISIQDMKQLAPDELLKRVAEGIRGVEDPAKRLSLATELFSRRARDLMPFLLEGKDGIAQLGKQARDTGFVLSEDAEKGVGKYISAMHLFRASIEGLRRTIASDAIAEVTKWIEAFQAWYEVNRELVKSKLLDFMKGLVAAAKIAGVVFGALFIIFDKLVELIGGYERAIKWATAALAFYALVAATNAGVATLSLIASIKKAGGIMKWFGNTALLAWLKAAAPVALVIAGILAVILILEDLVAWSEGKDSIFGRMFGAEKTKEMYEKVKWVLVAIAAIIGIIAIAMGGWVIAIIALVGAFIGMISTMWDEITAFFTNLYGWIKLEFTQFGEQIKQMLMGWFTPLILGWLNAKTRITTGFREMVDTLKRWASEIFGTFDKITSGARRVLDFVNPFGGSQSGAQLAGAAIGGGAAGPGVDAQRRANQVQNNRSTQTSVGQVSVNIQGTSDMGPIDLARATEDGINRALARHVRNASEAFDGGEDYG